MASSKKIGFFCGEEKLTVVELENNTSVQAVSALLGPKVDSNSPFSSTLTEEMQITALLQKILLDYRIKSGDLCVSLPIKDIILRSFIIPWVNPRDLHNVIKFEAKKYVPFDIQALSFVYHTVPFTENQIRRIQVIFFAVRREVLARYERISQQLKMNLFFCDPCPVSLAKALLYKKEIKGADHFAFLYLDKNSGYICFINQGIPQFIREFQMSAPAPSPSGQVNEGGESQNLKIINDVGSSFDFYARQFNTDRVEQMIVSSHFGRQALIDALAAELKVKIKNFSPLVTTVGTDQVNHMEAIYALGAGVDVSHHALSDFNFFADKNPKSKFGIMLASMVEEYKGIFFTFLLCVFFLGAMYVFFQRELKNTQKQYDELAARQGTFLNVPLENLQTQIQDNTNKISDYKDIRIKSDTASILLKVASLLPQGAWLQNLKVTYEGSGIKNTHVTIEMSGYILKNDLHKEIEDVNGLVLGLRKDKILSGLIAKVDLGSLTRTQIEGWDVTSFSIHCS